MKYQHRGERYARHGYSWLGSLYGPRINLKRPASRRAYDLPYRQAAEQRLWACALSGPEGWRLARRLRHGLCVVAGLHAACGRQRRGA